jgi:hypothetical protein
VERRRAARGPGANDYNVERGHVISLATGYGTAKGDSWA